MKQFTLHNRTFHIDNEGYTFINDYCQRLHRAILSYNLDTNVYDDVCERIVEKMSQRSVNGTLHQNDCIAIANEIGEPHDIFDDIENSDMYESVHKSIHKEPYTGYDDHDTISSSLFTGRTRRGSIGFFVCILLATRVTFVTGGTFMRLLFVSALGFGVLYVVRTGGLPTVKGYTVFVRGILGGGARTAGHIGRRVLYGVLGISLLCIGVGCIVLIAAIVQQYSPWNISLFAHVPSYTYYGIIAAIIVCIILYTMKHTHNQAILYHQSILYHLRSSQDRYDITY